MQWKFGKNQFVNEICECKGPFLKFKKTPHDIKVPGRTAELVISCEGTSNLKKASISFSNMVT